MEPPIKTQHITDYLDRNAHATPDKLAIVCDDRELSWRQLNQAVGNFAESLYQELGHHKTQQVVGILLPNSWQFVVSYLAILKLGHIAMPIDATFKQLEVGAVIDQIPTILNITDAHYGQLFDSANHKVRIFEQLKIAGNKKTIKYLRLSPEQQIASLFFTSGTTGQPKAAPNTHRNHIWNIEQCSRIWNWNSEDTWLISVQLSHMLGLVMGLSGIIYHGNTMYLQAWFDEVKTLQALASGRITMFTHISTAFSKLLETPGDYDISAVRLCISGGAALPPAVWQAFEQRFGKEILECYGTTETGRIASNLLDERIPGSPGRVLEGVSLKLSPENEVLIKSDGVFPGYYKNPRATSASYTKDGYWRTGDIGELVNGRIVLKGRLQERIRRFGYTISPRDVEWALLNNPRIKEAYVMGMPSKERDNDKLVYFMKSDLAEHEIKAYCKLNLPHAWRTDIIIKVSAIPQTKNGKPRITELRKLASRSVNA